MKPIYNVLIIGCGRIAGGFDEERRVTDWPLTHAGAYLRHGQFQLAGCVEPNAERRLGFIKRWNVEQGFSSIKELEKSDKKFDVISICSPSSQHMSDLDAAINMRPSIIFCEKPLTTNVNFSREIIERCSCLEIMLVVNHTRRWDPTVNRFAQDFRTEKWGKIKSATATYNKGLLNNGSHMIDLIADLLGPVEAMFAGPPIFDAIDSDPSISGFLRCGSVLVSLNCGDASDFSVFELEIVSERSIVRMQNGGQSWTVREIVASPFFEGYKILGKPKSLKGKVHHSMLLAVADIVRVLETSGDTSQPVKDAVNAQVVCERLRELSVKFVENDSL
ncbi:Gfo/Idh/MocA family oxidoreductase [Candidatus Puniceispirillum sp.]|nr:Gfo/Idh/MocA family oxidoreductase [Candidatus Puniceispirillum sp.]